MPGLAQFLCSFLWVPFALFASALPSFAQTDPVNAVPGDSETWTLHRCVETALDSNGSLQAERKRVAELEAQLTQARSEGLPVFDLSGSWSRNRDPSFAFDDAFTSDPDDKKSDGFSLSPEEISAQTSWRTSLDGRWVIRPQRIFNAVRGAKLAVDRQRVIVSGAELSKIEDVVRSYYDVLLAAENVSTRQAEVDAAEEFLEIARRKLRVELGTELDTLQARVSLANLEPDLRRTKQDLRDSGAELNILLGRPPLSPLALDSTYPIETVQLTEDKLRDGVERRADLQEREFDLSVLKKQRGAQKSMHRPYLSLNGSYGYVGNEIDGILDEGHESWSAQVALTVPIFDGLLTRGRVNETSAAIHRTEHEQVELKRLAVLEASQLHGNLQSAAATLRATELNVEAADEVLRRTTRRYELGKSDHLSVLNARQDRFRARSILTEARHEVLTLTASLKRALGLDPSRQWSELPLR